MTGFELDGLLRQDAVADNPDIAAVGIWCNGNLNRDFVARQQTFQGGGGTDIAYAEPCVSIDWGNTFISDCYARICTVGLTILYHKVVTCGH